MEFGTNPDLVSTLTTNTIVSFTEMNTLTKSATAVNSANPDSVIIFTRSSNCQFYDPLPGL